MNRLTEKVTITVDQKRSIVATVKPNAEVSMEAFGFEGHMCEEEIHKILNGMTTPHEVTDSRKKQEYVSHVQQVSN